MREYAQGLATGACLMSMFWAFFNAERFARNRYKWEKERGMFGKKGSWFTEA